MKLETQKNNKILGPNFQFSSILKVMPYKSTFNFNIEIQSIKIEKELRKTDSTKYFTVVNLGITCL